jgi:PAS domain S-box-containing protein
MERNPEDHDGQIVQGGTTENLRQSEEMFALLVESVREYAIFLLDPTGHVASWNAGARRLKGYEPVDIIGQHFSRFYPPEVPRERIQDELQIAIREGQFRDEGWRLRKDGSRFWADVTITPVRDDQGRLRGFAKVTRDMTAHKAAAEERAQLIREQAARAEAERANQMKDTFLATLSHELRTPLNAIVGWAHLLDPGTLDPQTAKAVEIIRRNASIQARLISDMLDISRIGTGKMLLRVERVDLRPVIQAAMDSLAPAATAKGIRLGSELAAELGQVSGDPSRLQQIVWNLVSNAVKFTPRGGEVEVRLARVNSHLEIEVRDTGIGMEPAFVPHVFEAFRQADGSPTRSHGGLGLGLAIVRQLSELHGGRVRAASAGLGRGSAFTVELPLLALSAEVLASDPPHPAAPNLYGLRVLVVEDDEDSRQLLKATLESYGAAVTLAASAAEGLAAFRAETPTVLVSDIEMPEVSGYDLIQLVRALPAWQGGLVPAIALTAYARPDDRLRALATGFQIHLSKPVHPLDLATAVATVTARAREPGF